MDNPERGTLDPTPTPAEPAPAPAPAPSPDPAAPPSAPDDNDPPAATEDFAAADTRVGLWECLNNPRDCTLAAPDPRTPGKPFEGPVQGAIESPITCPECGGDKVIYRGEKGAAVAA